MNGGANSESHAANNDSKGTVLHFEMEGGFDDRTSLLGDRAGSGTRASGALQTPTKPPTSHLPTSGQKCSVLKTLANVFISFIGAGILSLPHAFSKTGWLLGAVFMVGVAVLAYYCILLLVDCKKHLESQGVIQGAVTYPEVAGAALGGAGKLAVDLLLVLSQTGFCVAYVIFIYQNLSPVLDLQPAVIVLVVLPLQVMLAMLRDLSALAPFSLLADCAHVLGMVVVLKDDVQAFAKGDVHVKASEGPSAVPFLFGVVIFCYEGIGMILPIEDAMQDKSKFKTTLTVGFTVITTVFVVFGLVGYAAFGEYTHEIITNSLPEDWTTMLVKIALCCALFFTFPIMMVPVYEIAERALGSLSWLEKHVSPRRRWFVFKIVRTLIVGLIGLVAISVPGFSTFVSFIGSFCCASLAFILPSACHLILFNEKLSYMGAAMDYFMIIFGFTGMMFGVAQSLQSMIYGDGEG